MSTLGGPGSQPADASEVFHDGTGGHDRVDRAVRASGPDPRHRTDASVVEFADPDGDVWQPS